MTVFFSRLSYSFGNEDWSTERNALKIKPEDNVLCITASGDRPLNLLFDPCQSITCVDANQIQNNLLSLKCTAMQNFEYEQYLAFLGILPDKNRKQKLTTLIRQMDADIGEFWLKHKKMIAKGILYQGVVERLTKKVAFVFSLCRRKTVKKLFEMNDLNEQKRFVAQQWHHPWMKKAFEFVLSPFLTRSFIKDPGLYAHLKMGLKPGTYIYERMNSSLNRHLAKENLLLSLVLKGEVLQEAFPPYLTKEGTSLIKERLKCLKIETADVVEFLEATPKETFDCFSLSDVASYLNEENFIRLLHGIYKTAKPGARFSMRQFLSSHKIPTALQPFFVRDAKLEKRLEEEDKCFVYRFMVGTIKK